MSWERVEVQDEPQPVVSSPLVSSPRPATRHSTCPLVEEFVETGIAGLPAPRLNMSGGSMKTRQAQPLDLGRVGAGVHYTVLLSGLVCWLSCSWLFHIRGTCRETSRQVSWLGSHSGRVRRFGTQHLRSPAGKSTTIWAACSLWACCRRFGLGRRGARHRGGIPLRRNPLVHCDRAQWPRRVRRISARPEGPCPGTSATRHLTI